MVVGGYVLGLVGVSQEVADDEWVPTAPEPTPILLPLVVVAIALGAVP